jgi:hypothetical protein
MDLGGDFVKGEGVAILCIEMDPATMTGLKIYLKIPYNQLHIKN